MKGMNGWSIVLECTGSVQGTRTAYMHPESGIRLGLGSFHLKEVGRYFRKVSGIVETCGCGGVAWESDVETQ